MSSYIFHYLLLDMVALITGLDNAALFKPAMQSSLYRSYYAYRANDGNRDSNAYHGSCQHTNPEAVPWWMVDLLGQFAIDEVRLTNRLDLNPHRLRNFDIDIFGQDPRRLENFPNVTGQVCYNQTDPLDGGTFNFSCNDPTVGRYVRIVVRSDVPTVMHICEMEVLVSGSVLEEIDFQRKINTKLLDSPFAELTLTNSFACLRECLLRRSTDFCTASNWITLTSLCQLFSVNPNLNIKTNLTTSPGTHFYIQLN